MADTPAIHADDAIARPNKVARYRHRISGPLIDRIDMHVELMALPVEQLRALDKLTC
jgi:magnesium chelatase family protein